MFKNYLKIAFRNLNKRKTLSLINISGFAIGIACCVLLYLFIRNEWTFDNFHNNADKIFRVIKIHNDFTGDKTKQVITPAILGPTLVETFPNVRQAVRFIWGGGIFKYNDNIDREGFLYTDPSIFNMFSFKLSQGNPNSALCVSLPAHPACRKFIGVRKLRWFFARVMRRISRGLRGGIDFLWNRG